MILPFFCGGNRFLGVISHVAGKICKKQRFFGVFQLSGNRWDKAYFRKNALTVNRGLCYSTSTCEGLHELPFAAQQWGRKVRADARKVGKMLFTKGNRWGNFTRLGGTAATIGMHMVSSIIVGLAIGYYLDRYFGTQPWLIAIFFLLGVTAGFRMVYQDFKLIQKRLAEEQRRGSLKQDGEKGAGSGESGR